MVYGIGLSEPKWYLIRTKRWCEEQVAAFLEEQEVEFFAPSLERARPTRTGRRIIPLLPSYVFVRLRIPSDEYLRVRSAPGVAELVSFGGSPAVIHDGVVQVIRDRVQRENRAHSGDRLTKEERAEVARRLVRHVEIVFDTRRTADDRVRALVDFSRRIGANR